MESVLDFTCRKLTEEDLPEVNKFIQTYFAPRAILAIIFKVNLQFYSLFSTARAKTIIDDNISLGVFDNHGKMVRLTMAKIQERNKICEHPTIVGENCPRHQARKRFLHCLQGNVFSDLGAKKVMVLCLVTGHPAYHGQRLWKKMNMFDLFEAIGRENECEYIVSSAVSIYAQKMYHEAGFSIIREIRISEYIDSITGCKPDLNLSDIHTRAMLLCKKIT